MFICSSSLGVVHSAVQDPEDGGISDRPDNMADVFHTFFGVAGLGLMGREGIAAIDPAFALPNDVMEYVRSLEWPEPTR